MAKKKKKTGKRKGGKKSGDLINFQKLIGFAGAAFGNKQIDSLSFVQGKDPKLISAAKAFGGEWLQKQDFIKGIITDDSMRGALGDGLAYKGVKGLMVEFGIGKIHHAGKRRIGDSDDLAVVTEDVLGEDEMSEDVLGDDEMGDDEMDGDDLSAVNGEEDLSAVNEDVLGDDDEYSI
jgi:hypothetical protein